MPAPSNTCRFGARPILACAEVLEMVDKDIPHVGLARVVPNLRLNPPHAARRTAAVVSRRLETCLTLAVQGRGVGAGRYVDGVGHALAIDWLNADVCHKCGTVTA